MKEGTTFLLAMAALGVSATFTEAQGEATPASQAIKLHADILYNSNVAASSEALASLRGLTRSDQIYSPAVDLNFAKQLGLESVFLSGQAGYDFYQRNTVLNRERLNAAGGVGAEVAGCQITFHGSYARAQSDLQDLAVVVTKNTQEDVSGAVQGTCNPTGKLVPSFSVTQSLSDNSAPILFTSDSHSLATQGSIGYKNTLLGEISLFGQYTDTQFPHRLLTLSGGADGYKVYAGGLSLDHHFGSDLDFLFSLSQEALRSAGGTGPKFDGLTYDSTLSYQVGPRLRTSLTFSRKTNPSNRLDASYSVDQSYQVAADYKIASNLLFHLGASQIKSAVEGVALIQGVDLTKQSTKSFFGALAFDISRQLSVNLTASQDQRHADVLGYSYASTRFGLSVSQAF